MRSQFASLRVLVLPFGALTGPRIVLDGINGRIDLYDALNQLYASINPASGFVAGSPPGPTATLGIIGGDVDRPAVIFDTGDTDDDTGHIEYFVLGAGGTRNIELELATPIFALGDAARVALISGSADGTEGARVVLDADEATINAKVIPRGIIDQFPSDTNDGPHTGDTVTDMVLSNVEVIAGHTYAVHLHTQVTLSAAVGVWLVQARVNGTVIGRFARLANAAAVIGVFPVDSTVYWTPSVTASTDDIDVFVDEQSGTADLQLDGAPTAMRWLTLVDLGVL